MLSRRSLAPISPGYLPFGVSRLLAFVFIKTQLHYGSLRAFLAGASCRVRE